MNKEYITVKEFAEILGVSTQYVYKQLNNKLQPYCKVVGNKKMLKKSAISVLAKKEDATEVVQQLNNQLNGEINAKLIEMLENELNEKGNQLKEKDKQIAELQKALDQAQKLHAMDKQRIQELEYKKEDEKEEEPVEQEEPTEPKEYTEPQEQLPRTFKEKIKWLFSSDK